MLLRGDANDAAALAAQMHLAFREESRAGQRRGNAVQLPSRAGRGGDPAALRPHRQERISRDGHRKRRPDHPGGAARGRRDHFRQMPTRQPGHRAAGRRHDAVAGNLEGARHPSRRPGCSGRQFARTGAASGGADGARRAQAVAISGRDGDAARHRHCSAGRRRAAGRRRHHPVGDHERRAVLSRHRLDDRHSRRCDDAAVDRDGAKPGPRS